MMVRLSATIERGWEDEPALRVGDAAAFGRRTPDMHVFVDSTAGRCRIDVYAPQPDCFAFQEGTIWRDVVFVGFGSYVYAASLLDRTVVSYPLGSYFGYLYPTAAYLLIASGTRVLRIEPDRSVLWTTEALGVDGVIVHDAEPPVIRGAGEWDPPGGWRPFFVDSETGALSPPES